MLCVPTARAGDDWNQADTVRQVIASGFIVLDWSQTLYIADHPDQFYETNSIMGKHPSRATVNVYMLTNLISHHTIARWLSPSSRKWFQYSTIAVEAYWIHHNIQIGIGFSF